MKTITWEKRFEIGIAEVDHEHRELIGLINKALASIDSGASEEEVVGYLGEINADISSHFALEERQMQDRHYPGMGAHKADHEELLDEIRDLMDGRADYPPEAFADHLSNWFLRHFSTEDVKFHRWLWNRPG